MADEIQNPRTLLLVDDEPNITNALKRTLRRDGYAILSANSGEEGMELLSLHKVGVIISDQRMPKMTGVEFLRKVKSLYPNTLRMVLSGYTELESITRAINEGAIYKFLTKPWDDEHLRENIRDAFHRYEMEQENLRLAEEIRRANEELSRLNQNLEQEVMQKTREIRKNINMLQISQEILEHLPLAIIGIDDQNMIAISNKRADELFCHYPGESLPGAFADQYLPESLLQIVQNALLDDAANFRNGMERLVDGTSMHVWVSTMGESSRSRGTVVVLSPTKEI